MKIDIVTSDASQAQAIAAHFSSGGSRRHAVTCHTAEAGRLEHAFAVAPDLIVYAEGSGMREKLPEIDALTTAHPAVALVLAAEDQSPEFLRAAMRAGVREVLPLPLTGPALDEAISMLERKCATSKQERANGKVFAFIGCKGGAGTTFLATNWAHVLASRPGCRVAFIDMNRQFGDALFYLSDETPSMDLADLAREAQRLDGSLLTASMVTINEHLHVLAAAETPEKAKDIGIQEVALLLKHAAREYDVVIVDVGNVMDEISALVMDAADRVYPVMQATLPYLRAATRLFKVLRGYPREKVEWIVNRYEKQGDVSLEDIGRALDHAGLRTIAGNFRTVCASINQGVPLAQLSREDHVVRDLKTWACAIFPEQDAQVRESWWRRWFGRSRRAGEAATAQAQA
jgi:pilus assembly protein CpaE